MGARLHDSNLLQLLIIPSEEAQNLCHSLLSGKDLHYYWDRIEFTNKFPQCHWPFSNRCSPPSMVASAVADDMLDYTVDNIVVVGKIKNEII